MSRVLTPTLRNAIDIPDSYYMLLRADFYPSRIYFESVNDDYVFPGLGTILKEEIVYSAVSDKLVTFFYDDNHLKYMIEGSSEVTIIDNSSFDVDVYNYPPADAKPGVIGSTLYFIDIYNCPNRCTIDWTKIAARNTKPLSPIEIHIGIGDYESTTTAFHALSATEAVLFIYDDGGFRALYINGTDYNGCPVRFMSPSMMPYVDKDGNTPTQPTIPEQIIRSGCLSLGNKIFAYMSNSKNGSVEGVYYDKDTETWGDIFTAVLTDLDVSLCEFRISNTYSHNNTAYMCGQFYRLDGVDDAEPYTLLLYSNNGKTFSIENNTLVSNIGYRFLATVGASTLYLSSANRVCSADVTWVFDGAEGFGRMASLDEADIKGIDDQNSTGVNVTVRSGMEEFFDSQDIVKGAKMILYVGMKATDGDEYVEYGTYIIDQIAYSLAMGKRDTVISATNEATSKLSGLSMPFYAELTGKSVAFSSNIKDSGELYCAPGGYHTETKFSLDMWKHEAYSGTATITGVTGIDMHTDGGVDYYTGAASHKLGIITDDELMNILILDSNPKIVGDDIVVDIQGWSRPGDGGGTNDTVSLVLVTVDDKDVESSNLIVVPQQWSITYPEANQSTGNDPIQVTVDAASLGIVGQRIKKVGLVFECTNETWFCVARLDFLSGVEAYFTYPDNDIEWDKEDDGSFKLPHIGRPYIMFSRNVYNSFNFSLAAEFTNGVAQGDTIEDYPVATGLVGLAQDGANYIAGRYNKTNNKVELVKCRNGIESILLDTTPGFTIADSHKVRFDHKGGHFDIYMWNDSTNRFERVLYDVSKEGSDRDPYGYDWNEADGDIYTSRTASMWCGIYGVIFTPTASILGYYAGDSDNIQNADGIPVSPLSDISDFPDATEGNPRHLVIGDDTFSYGGEASPANTSGKIVHPTPCRGPYQYREMGKYDDPYGTGEYGLECRDFDWTASEDLTVGKLIAISSGANFVSTGDDWTIWITTGGEVVWVRDRARHYSANEQIGKLYHTLAHKVWVVGGFEDITLLSTKSTRVGHSEGETAYYEILGDIKCQWFMGAGGLDDTTVEDLITEVCDIAGARCSFPGDYNLTTFTPSGLSPILTLPYAEGVDLRFELQSDDNGVVLQTDIKIKPDNYEQKTAILNDTDISLSITNEGSGVWAYEVLSKPSNTRMYATKFTAKVATQKFRILYQGNAISLYQNGQWVTTITFDELDYGNSLTIQASGSMMGNVCIEELGDWREAVFIDLETDGRSAVGSIIQQRPIEVIAQSDGSLQFYYEITRDIVFGIREPRTHKRIQSVPRDGASDAIVYGSKDAKTIQNKDYARELGFGTKLFRMSDLNIGAVRAANVLLKKTFEGFRTHDLTIRPDLAIMNGDIYHLEYDASGTKRHEEHDIIIENTSIEVKMQGSKTSSSMDIHGREVYVEPINQEYS